MGKPTSRSVRAWRRAIWRNREGYLEALIMHNCQLTWDALDHLRRAEWPVEEFVTAALLAEEPSW